MFRIWPMLDAETGKAVGNYSLDAGAPAGRVLAGALLAMMLAIFVTDLRTPGNVVISSLYVIPLLASGLLHRKSWVWGITALAIVLSAIDQLWGTPAMSTRWYFPLINRSIIALTQIACAAVVHRLLYYRVRMWEAMTELERRRREAVEMAERKTRFLASVSHDIRTPANSISLLAEVILRTAQSAPNDPEMFAQLPELARDLQRSSLSLVSLVGDVLDVTRYDFGKAVIVPVELPFNEWLNDEARQLRPLADAKGLVFQVELAEEIELYADPAKLSRVLTNLMGNAIKFTQKGSVRVCVDRSDDGGLHIAVRDTGPGIAPEVMPYIFDEFYQVRHHTQNGQTGSGLGLAIAKRLAEAMGATLTVESEVGVGTTFTLQLPPRLVLRATPLAAHPAAPRIEKELAAESH